MLRPLVRPLVRALTRSPMESRGLRPTLSLDFTNGGVTDSRVTYSGGANGTRVNSAGLIVAATTPRFDYNPVTLAPLGLLVEEARTNLLTYSDDYTSPNTFLSGGTAATVTPAAGGLCSTRQTFAGAGNQVIKTVSGNSTTAYANTIRLKAGTATTVTVALRNNAQSISIQYTVNLATQAFTDTSYGSPTSKLTPSIELVGGGEYEVTIGGVLNAAGGAETIRHCLFSTMAGTLDCGGGQLEAGSFPTSYIPTTSAAVTRSVDSAVMTGTNFSSWYNQTQGTFVVNAISAPGLGSVAQASLEVDDGTTNVRQVLFKNGSGLSNAQVGNSGTQADLVGDAWAASTLGKMAFAYAPNDFAMSFNAATCITDVSGTVPTVTQMVIGDTAGANRAFNGRIQSIRYYPQRLPNATLQGMTA